MEYANTLDGQMYRFGFWSVLIVIASGIASGFMPLDVPGGYAAAHTDRVLWLQANRTLFIASWVNQIVAMFSLSGVFACSAWLIARSHTLRAMLAAMMVFMSIIAFIIPKLMAIWTIPLLGDIDATEIEDYFLGLTPLLIVAIVAAGFVFRGHLKSHQ